MMNTKVSNTIQNILKKSRFNQNNCRFRTADLEANINIANLYKGADFILVDRSYGSLVFPVGRGCAPGWMKAYSSYQEAIWYQIDADGTGREINQDEAMRLIEKLPQSEGVSKYSLLRNLVIMLKDGNVTNSGMVACSLTTKSTIGEWKRWFRNSGNNVMLDFIINVEKKLYV
ncbi:hypothetical protein [Vibrio sp. 10N.239.312.D08]|uniref:hypothetical protein n=1 Tax=Vibrio sp. 10N.239.312.D08 TaxID=3229978 RepID=UPI00354F37BC